MTSQQMTSLDRVKEILDNQLMDLNTECLFRIEVKDNNNEYDPEDLVSNEEIQGVLIAPNTIYASSNDGTEQLQCELHFVVPLDSRNSSANASLQGLIRKINNKEFTIEGVEETFIITGAQLLTGSKLDGNIGGVDYEELTIVFQVYVSKSFIRSEKESITIDDMLLNGKIAITAMYQKTCDGRVYNDSPLQKNAVNGIQLAITIDFIMFKEDQLHKAIIQSARSLKTHTVKYFDGYEENVYKNCIITSLETTSINGDVKKAKMAIALSK